MNKSIILILITLIGWASTAATNQRIELIQNSNFGAMYSEGRQNTLLYDSRQIIEDVFYKQLNCQDVQVDASVTEVGKDGFWISLMGETVEPTFEIKISAVCPEEIKNLETYVYFGFERDDIPVAFYFAYNNVNLNETKSFVVIDEVGYLPNTIEGSYPSIALCEETWFNDKVNYPLLFKANCNQ